MTHALTFKDVSKIDENGPRMIFGVDLSKNFGVSSVLDLLGERNDVVQISTIIYASMHLSNILYLSVYLPIYLSFYLSIKYLSTIGPSIHLYLSIYLSIIYPSIHLSISLSIYLSIYLLSIYVSICKMYQGRAKRGRRFQYIYIYIYIHNVCIAYVHIC